MTALPVPLEDTEHADLANRSTSALAFARTAEVALIALEHSELGFDFRHSSRDAPTQLMEVPGRRVAMNSGQIRSRSCGDLEALRVLAFPVARPRFSPAALASAIPFIANCGVSPKAFERASL